MLGTATYVLLTWGQVGAVNSGNAGQGGGGASKESLVILLVVTWFLFAGLTMAEQLPKLFGGQKQPDPAVNQIMGELITMVRALKLLLVVLFSYLVIHSAKVHELPDFLMPFILGGAMLLLVVSILRLNWMKRKA